MSDLAATSGSRQIRIPANNEEPFGENVNHFLRSFGGLNITKFSILYNVPHGTYLGGYESPETNLSLPDPMGKKMGMFFGYRKLPNHDTVNIINGGFRNSQKYVFAIDDSGTPSTIFTTPFYSRISDTNRTYSLMEQDSNYLLFDMNRTFVWPILTQYPFVSNHESQQKGYTPFYKVSEITPAARDPRKLYTTPSISNDNINIVSADRTPLLSVVDHGCLFCMQYYYVNKRKEGPDDLPGNGTAVSIVDGVFMNPGVANVMFIEFGNTENQEYREPIEYPKPNEVSFTSGDIQDAFGLDE